MDRLIHTPEGVRDVYNQECTKKLYLENQIEQVFHAFGYQDIETPTFEFFDVFGREVGTTPSRELYKFFDRDGNTLVLRPDFTPSIARAASMYFMEAAAKTDWIFFAAPAPRILRLLDEYKMRGHPSDALSFYIHAAIGKISFKTPKITAEIAAASRKPWQMRRLFAANLASSCSF